jgi:hypothetical protein
MRKVLQPGGGGRVGVLTTVCKVTWRELQVRAGPWKGSPNSVPMHLALSKVP